MGKARSILIIEADPAFRKNAGRYLSRAGFEVHEAPDVGSGLHEARTRGSRFVLIDVAYQAQSGLDLVHQIRELPHHPDVICMAQQCPVHLIVAAVRAGALDVLDRPVDGERLVRLLEHALTPDTAPVHACVNTHLVLDRDPQVDIDVAESPSMRRALKLVEHFAQGAQVMVVEGECGAGHEVMAHHFHRAGSRSEGPLVTVPSVPIGGTSPHDLLFGSQERVSAFARAKGGVVFIESLISLKEDGQERLFRLLDGLAAAHAAGSDVRWPPMVIGLDRPLDAEVRAGHVLPGLATQLRSSVVTMPPLRERVEDVPVLIRRVWTAVLRQAGMTEAYLAPEVVDALARRSWEGNIPELIATVRRAAAVDPQGCAILDPSMATEPFEIPAAHESGPSVHESDSSPRSKDWHPSLDSSGQVQPYEVYEAEIFRFALEHAGGCVSRAAELLGVGRATMYRKMRTYHIDVPPVAERTMARSRQARQKRAEERARRAAMLHMH